MIQAATARTMTHRTVAFSKRWTGHKSRDINMAQSSSSVSSSPTRMISPSLRTQADRGHCSTAKPGTRPDRVSSCSLLPSYLRCLSVLMLAIPSRVCMQRWSIPALLSPSPIHSTINTRIAAPRIRAFASGSGPNPTPGQSPFKVWPFVLIFVAGSGSYVYMVKNRTGEWVMLCLSPKLTSCIRG